MRTVFAAMATLVLAVPAFAQRSQEQVRTDDEKQENAHPRVRLVTSVGDIVIKLFEDKAPLSVENFLQYVRDGFYDGLAFHRVKADFMIQTGGYDAELEPRTEGLRPAIKNESRNGLKNERGTVAMARLSDPHSATSQFFINVSDNPHLDRGPRQPYGYTVFGQVVEGMDVVDRIQHARTIQHEKDPRKGQDGPVNPDPPIVIEKAIEEKTPATAEESAGEE
jgi:cyclophilin family peptidyl-prolyl cis-trans isomerase